MAASVSDFWGRTSNSGDATKSPNLAEEKQMKLRAIATLVMAATAAAIGFAPIAAAAPTGTTVPTDATVHQSPGNAQITAQPGPAASEAGQLQQPFGGSSNALIFHH
jgi:hypothetical protein